MKYLIILIFISSYAVASEQYPHDIKKIKSDLELNGGKHVFYEIFADFEIQDAFLSHVKSGKTEYLEVALSLWEYTDASITYDLEMSVSHALVTNPKFLLPKINNNKYLKSQSLCMVPFVGDFEMNDYSERRMLHEKKALNYTNQAIQVLNSDYGKLNTEFTNYCLPYLIKFKKRIESVIKALTIRSSSDAEKRRAP